MITPSFSVTQDHDFIRVQVKVSNIRFSAPALEMVAENDVFVFSLPPYYLRLRFPHNVVDDERATATFDLALSHVNISLPKEVPGQEFPDLDLAAKLLARKEQPKKPLIEELDRGNTLEFAAEAESHDWELPQTMPTSDETPASVSDLNPTGYGFNNAYTQTIGVSTASGNDINELGDPERATPTERTAERLIKENIKFDPEYYAADFLLSRFADDDKNFASLIAWKAPSVSQFLAWYKKQRTLPEDQREQLMLVDFTPEEQTSMQNLPKKSYLIEASDIPGYYALILSVLFAYYYDLRENEGDSTVESAWTVGKLVPQFACLDFELEATRESPVRAALITGYRRSLCFPYHRHYNLALKAWDDVYHVLRGGKRLVLKNLLAIRELFRYHDVYYVYDHIWMQDLCLWVLNDVGEKAIRQLAHDLKSENTKLTKADIVFEKVLESLEDFMKDEIADLEKDSITALSVADIEQMADDSYDQME